MNAISISLVAIALTAALAVIVPATRHAQREAAALHGYVASLHVPR